MSSPSLRKIEQALIESGVEIYSEHADELQIAERTRMHLMDSGVRVRLSEARIQVQFTVTASRSEHPVSDPHELFSKMRERIGRSALSRGYRELRTSTLDARDPQDGKRILDVFYEVAYALDVPNLEKTADEVRWALSLEKVLPPHT